MHSPTSSSPEPALITSGVDVETGGAVANVGRACARLGLDTAFAGYLASMLEGGSPADALELATAVGAASTERVGPTLGIPPRSELTARLDAGWRHRPTVGADPALGDGRSGSIRSSQSGSTRRDRPDFSWERLSLSARRRSTDARVGRVGRRGLSAREASTTSWTSRSSARWRFNSWLRSLPIATRSSSPAVIRPPSFPRTRASSAPLRGSSDSGTRSSTRVAEVLTCWPPGPLERDAEKAPRERTASRISFSRSRPMHQG